MHGYRLGNGRGEPLPWRLGRPWRMLWSERRDYARDHHLVPQHLQPNVIIENIQRDIEHGPGETNNVTGRKGWLRQRLGF